MLHGLSGWHMKDICFTHIFYKINILKHAFSKGLKCVEVEKLNQISSGLKIEVKKVPIW